MSYTRGLGVTQWHSIDSLDNGPFRLTGAASFQAWPTASMAVYVPLIIPTGVVVTSLWFASYSTGTGNYDIGLYNASGSRLLSSGSTAKPAATQEVVWDCTDTFLGAGLYYVALVSNTNTDDFGVVPWSPSPPLCAAMGLLTEASALPLPATATWTVNQSLGIAPIVGLFLNTVVT